MLRFFTFICPLVLFLLFTLNPLNKSASALSNETDYSALLKFKESISNDPFGVLNSWNSSNHFCKWGGVTCSHKHRRVIEIILVGYQLEGSISPYVGNLSFLKIFYLDNNRFHGNVPPELRRLLRLQSISLANNTLGGKFPIMSLTNCSYLWAIDLSANQFIGQIPMEIHSLSKLEFFQVAKNNLTGRIPPSIWNLSSLTTLSLPDNHLEGNIPEEISLLKHLTGMSVSVNKLSGTLPFSLYNMSSLTHLFIAYNHFSGSLPTNMFSTLPNLRQIFFGSNRFSGPIPASITNATRIQRFDIGLNNFVGQIPNLGKLQDLFYLVVADNNLGNNSPGGDDWEFIKSLVNCSQLDIVIVENNNFGGPLPKIIGNLSTHLSQLAMSGNQISGKIPTELGNLVNLNYLSLAYNLLTDVIPESFAKFRNMQELFLSANNLSGEIPTAMLRNFSKLSQMDLSNNFLMGKIPSTIGNCKMLQSSDFSMNNLSGAIPTQLFGLSSLSIVLNLSRNSLSGNLPPEVGRLKNIGHLDISENHLSGGIPEKIGDCSSLEYLFLEGNSFDGIIPSSLASLKGLVQLDLSRNNLSGLIPQELQNNSVLEWFNASFNNLEGEVPMLGVFANASRVSLIGNDRLCGGITKLNLQLCPPKALKRRKHHTHRKLIIIIVIISVAFLLLLSFVLTITIYQIRRKKQKKASTNSTIELLPKVSYQELHHATDGFSIQNLLGTGGIGVVYKGRFHSEERFVAVKVLNLQNKGAHKSFITECNAFRNIRHRNLVKIITCCSSVDYKGNDFKALVFEYMTNGSLEEWLHQNAEQQRTLNFKTRIEIVNGISSALHYLHYECEQPIVHCDLKPSNVLLDDDMVAHVSDFGLAKLFSTIDGDSNKQTSSIGIKGTIGYTPPEYGMDSQLSIEGDIYSFGILLLEMFTGRRPTDEMFKDGHNLHNYVKIAFPNNIMDIVDANLLSMENEHIAVTTEIASDLHPNVEKCLFSLFKIGLSCSVEFPRERMNINEVITELNIISKDLPD